LRGTLDRFELRRLLKERKLAYFATRWTRK